IRWWLSKGAAFVGIVIFTVTASAQQVLQTNRYEIPSSRDENAFEVIPAHDQGIFLYRRISASNSDHIQLIKLDTAFNEQWKGFLPIDNKYVLIGKKVEQGKLHFLLRYQDYSRNNFQLFSIETGNGNFFKYDIKNFIPFNTTEFQVTEKAALIGGYYNQVPVVLYYSFQTQKAKVLPGLLNETGELTQLKIYPDGTFDVLISARNFKGQQTVWIKNYDADGDLQRNYALEPEESKHLIFARSMKTSNNMQLVAGVFGGRNSQYSRGLFLASIDPAGGQQLRYYNYGDLENFFNYMTAKREARVKERIERRKIKGKRVRFNYRFLVHEIVPYKNQYILLGEAFYPKYITTDRTYGTFFYSGLRGPSMMTRDGRIFDGYYYTHAVVMGFDLNGKLLWDNSFEINDVKTFTLEQFVKLEVQKDRIALLYLFDNELRTKIIQNNQVLEGKTSSPLKTLSAQDVVKKDQMDLNKMDYWYNDFFYACGVQEINNAEKGKRRVFFINKITCH
ncbi:MAG TPA: hypothetical protein VK666_24535, partial [Chryseolinea sp.]|nr:hypothetical protein [Chryseolinea sp.]